MPIRVLIADDDAATRLRLRLTFDEARDIDVVDEVADGEQAVAAAAELHPDVALLDVRMPKLDGIEATRRIATENGSPRALILTGVGNEQYVYEAMRAGASGFLLKNAPPSQLIDAVRIVNAGDALLAPEVTRQVIERFTQAQVSSVITEARIADLTARELEVLRLIARGMSNAEIAGELGTDEAAIGANVTELLGKLGLRDRTQAVVAAYECGLVTAAE